MRGVYKGNGPPNQRSSFTIAVHFIIYSAACTFWKWNPTVRKSTHSCSQTIWTIWSRSEANDFRGRIGFKTKLKSSSVQSQSDNPNHPIAWIREFCDYKESKSVPFVYMAMIAWGQKCKLRGKSVNLRGTQAWGLNHHGGHLGCCMGSGVVGTL